MIHRTTQVVGRISRVGGRSVVVYGGGGSGVGYRRLWDTAVVVGLRVTDFGGSRHPPGAVSSTQMERQLPTADK